MLHQAVDGIECFSELMLVQGRHGRGEEDGVDGVDMSEKVDEVWW